MTLPERFAFGGNEFDGCPCPMAHLDIEPDMYPYIEIANVYDDLAKAYALEHGIEMDKYDHGTLPADVVEQLWADVVAELSTWEHNEELLDEAQYVNNELFA